MVSVLNQANTLLGEVQDEVRRFRLAEAGERHGRRDEVRQFHLAAAGERRDARGLLLEDLCKEGDGLGIVSLVGARHGELVRDRELLRRLAGDARVVCDREVGQHRVDLEGLGDRDPALSADAGVSKVEGRQGGIDLQGLADRDPALRADEVPREVEGHEHLELSAGRVARREFRESSRRRAARNKRAA